MTQSADGSNKYISIGLKVWNNTNLQIDRLKKRVNLLIAEKAQLVQEIAILQGQLQQARTMIDTLERLRAQQTAAMQQQAAALDTIKQLTTSQS